MISAVDGSCLSPATSANNGLSTGGIVGIAVGASVASVAAVVIAVGAVALFFAIQAKKRTLKTSEQLFTQDASINLDVVTM